ncbi:hypothetical protein Bhyg_10755, partial [Pseudolycoriella hygida]
MSSNSSCQSIESPVTNSIRVDALQSIQDKCDSIEKELSLINDKCGNMETKIIHLSSSDNDIKKYENSTQLLGERLIDDALPNQTITMECSTANEFEQMRNRFRALLSTTIVNSPTEITSPNQTQQQNSQFVTIGTNDISETTPPSIEPTVVIISFNTLSCCCSKYININFNLFIVYQLSRLRFFKCHKTLPLSQESFKNLEHKTIAPYRDRTNKEIKNIQSRTYKCFDTILRLRILQNDFIETFRKRKECVERFRRIFIAKCTVISFCETDIGIDD